MLKVVLLRESKVYMKIKVFKQHRITRIDITYISIGLLIHTDVSLEGPSHIETPGATRSRHKEVSISCPASLVSVRMRA